MGEQETHFNTPQHRTYITAWYSTQGQDTRKNEGLQAGCVSQHLDRALVLWWKTQNCQIQKVWNSYLAVLEWRALPLAHHPLHQDLNQQAAATSPTCGTERLTPTGSNASMRPLLVDIAGMALTTKLGGSTTTGKLKTVKSNCF